MPKLYKDIIERATWTFVQAFLAFYSIGGVGGWKAAVASAAAAALSVAKGAIASSYGNPDSASSIKDI
jgi:hypothetical protein